ncbi:hypothetical protein EDF62_3097 [Leucobacter luti]|uniref:Uncharacterized protein n=1 Tax=Leucobacter luti TaxID=340320 RepID=A0A4R6RSE9_9MICO|nr:hypothetical protein EDF62_3097 [Leucobacter luti]
MFTLIVDSSACCACGAWQGKILTDGGHAVTSAVPRAIPDKPPQIYLERTIAETRRQLGPQFAAACMRNAESTVGRLAAQRVQNVAILLRSYRAILSTRGSPSTSTVSGMSVLEITPANAGRQPAQPASQRRQPAQPAQAAQPTSAASRERFTVPRDLS